MSELLINWKRFSFFLQVTWQKCNTTPLVYFPNKWQQKLSCSPKSCATSYANWGKTLRISPEQIKASSPHTRTRSLAAATTTVTGCGAQPQRSWRPFPVFLFPFIKFHYILFWNFSAFVCMYMYTYVHAYIYTGACSRDQLSFPRFIYLAKEKSNPIKTVLKYYCRHSFVNIWNSTVYSLASYLNSLLILMHWLLILCKPQTLASWYLIYFI